MIEQPKFMDIVKTGRSLILVSNKGAHKRVVELMNSVYWSLCVVAETASEVHAAINIFAAREIMPNAQLLMHAQSAPHGFRLQVDRVIWIGPRFYDISDANQSAVYLQAMARGDMPWGRPAKWHYTEEQLFDKRNSTNG